MNPKQKQLGSSKLRSHRSEVYQEMTDAITGGLGLSEKKFPASITYGHRSRRRYHPCLQRKGAGKQRHPHEICGYLAKTFGMKWAVPSNLFAAKEMGESEITIFIAAWAGSHALPLGFGGANGNMSAMSEGWVQRDGSSSRRIGCQNEILDDSGNFADLFAMMATTTQVHEFTNLVRCTVISCIASVFFRDWSGISACWVRENVWILRTEYRCHSATNISHFGNSSEWRQPKRDKTMHSSWSPQTRRCNLWWKSRWKVAQLHTTPVKTLVLSMVKPAHEWPWWNFKKKTT